MLVMSNGTLLLFGIKTSSSSSISEFKDRFLFDAAAEEEWTVRGLVAGMGGGEKPSRSFSRSPPPHHFSRARQRIAKL
jgi:hypothetical protein